MKLMLSARVIIICCLALTFIFGGGYLVGLLHGRSKGYSEAATLQKASSFVAGFQTLRFLREGDTTNGLKRLETFCYSLAADIFNQSDKTSSMIVKLYSKELKDYRANHANPTSQLTPTEQRLDQFLEKNLSQ